MSIHIDRSTFRTIRDRARVLPGLGVGTPGLVDMRSGVIQSAVDVGWSEVPFRAMVEDALGMKTWVANRSKVGVLAELWHRAGSDIKNLIYISLGSGVAAGIVAQGELFVGSNSSAGELGHTTVVPDGPLCPCGNRGCLQQLVSAPAIANNARHYLRGDTSSVLNTLVGDRPEMLNAVMVMQAAQEGDALAERVVREAAVYLGIAIANLINVLNPQLIVLGSPIGHVAQAMLVPVREEVQRRAMLYPLSIVEILTSTLGPDTGAVGAAVLVLQHSSELLFRQAIPTA